MMDENGIWKPSPAYDLTFSDGPGGEHTMLLAKEGRNPSIDHLKALAEVCDVENGSKIIDQVHEAVGRFKVFAEKAEVPARLSNKTAKALALPSPRNPRGTASKQK